MKILQVEQLSGELLLARFEGLSLEIQEIKKHFEPKQPTQYLSRKEVADLFGVSLVTVNDWSKKGILTAYKIANRVYFKRHEIEAALVEIKARQQ